MSDGQQSTLVSKGRGREGKGYIAVPACGGSLAEAKRFKGTPGTGTQPCQISIECAGKPCPVRLPEEPKLEKYPIRGTFAKEHAKQRGNFGRGGYLRLKI
eukprot:1143561-Pelagomonas_calceolata.AAC.4